MSEPGQKAAEDLADLRAALRGLAGLHVDEASGAADEDGWWHVSVQIDRDDPCAWRTIAVLAKLFNTDTRPGGAAVFKPIARLAEERGEDDLILWSLSHQYGNLSLAEAQRMIREWSAQSETPVTVEE